MKTQMVPGAYDPVFFPKLPAKSAISGRAHAGSPYFPHVASESSPVGPIPPDAAVRHDNSSLPASLEDWLVCKEALDICQRGRNRTDAGSDAWMITTAKPMTRGLILSKAVSYERKGPGRG